MNRGMVGLVSVLLGAAGWAVGLQIGPGPTPFGAWYLLIVAAVGFDVALVEGDVSWTGLVGLYTGQVIALGLQALLAPTDFIDEPLAWLPVYTLSFMPAAALGGIPGAALRHAWRSREVRIGRGTGQPSMEQPPNEGMHEATWQGCHDKRAEARRGSG